MSSNLKKRKRSTTDTNNDNISEPLRKKQRLNCNPKPNNDIQKSNSNNSQTEANSSQQCSSEPLILTQNYDEIPNINTQSEDIDMTTCNNISETQTETNSITMKVQDDDNKIEDNVWAVLIPCNESFDPIQITTKEFKIGRHNSNHLILENTSKDFQSTISNYHATLIKTNTFKDISRNGSFITDPSKIFLRSNEHVENCTISLKNGSLLSFGKQNQNSSFYYFNMQRYLVSKLYMNNNNINTKFDVVLRKEIDSLELIVNGNVYRKYNQSQYKKDNIMDIINQFVSDIDASSLIYEYYGNIFEAISYDINTIRPPIIKPPLRRQNCVVGPMIRH